MTTASVVDVDTTFADRLARRVPARFGHRLAGDPRLSLESIAWLGDQLDGPAPNGTRLGVRNIERFPAYGVLVDQVVEAIASGAGVDPYGLRCRRGSVFAGSPESARSAHFDVEHSLVIQLEGRRRLGFGRFASPESREREVHRYWSGSFGRLDSAPVPTEELEIGPGDGAYIPPYTPHWLESRDSTSLTLTVTFFNRDNSDESMVQAFNEKVGRTGLRPRTYGEAPARDAVKVALMRVYGGVRRRIRRGTSAPQ